MVIATVVAVLAVGWKLGLFGLEDTARLRAALDRVRNVRGLVALFIGVYAVLSAVGVPASPLTLAGGALFGFRLGVLLNWTGAFLGALLAFASVRLVLGGVAARAMSHAPAVVRRLIAGSAPMLLFRLRLIPVVPFSLLNVGAALSPMTTRSFAAATAIGLIPVTVIYSLFAASLVAGAEGSGRRAFAAAMISAVAIILISMAPRWFVRGGEAE